MEVFRDATGTAGSRRERKPLQKRHSVASCFKQRVGHAPLKRRVSFSSKNSVHLIRRSNSEWHESPKRMVNACDIELDQRDENGLLEVPHDDGFSDGDTCEILNETMAFDTVNFSQQFLTLPDDPGENTNNLSELVAMDDSLPLPSSYMDARKRESSLASCENISMEIDDSEITYLGGSISPQNLLPLESEKDVDLSDKTMELDDMTEDLFAPLPVDDDAVNVSSSPLGSPCGKDDGFSAQFVLQGAGTESLSFLVAADQDDEGGDTLVLDPTVEILSCDEDCSEEDMEETKVLEDDDLEEEVPAKEEEEEESKEIAPFNEIYVDEEDKTENFLLDTSDHNGSTQNISEILCFAPASSSARWRETPVRTPLNLYHAPHLESSRSSLRPEPHKGSSSNESQLSVDEFLARVHISFRMFDTSQKHSSCTPLPARSLQHEFPRDQYLSDYLYHQQVVALHSTSVTKRNNMIKDRIDQCNATIASLDQSLSQNNPECFEASLLNRQQLPDLRQRTQQRAKEEWYTAQLEQQEEYSAHLAALSASLEQAYKGLVDQLVTMEFPTDETVTMTLPSTTTKTPQQVQLKKLTAQVEEQADLYDMLRACPDWTLHRCEKDLLEFVFGDTYQLTVERVSDKNVTCSLAIRPHARPSSVQRSLIANIQCNAILQQLRELADLPAVLEPLSLWIGRAHDIVDELRSVNESNLPLEIHLDTAQGRETASRHRTRVEMTWSGQDGRLPLPAGASSVTVACEFNVFSYPANISWSIKDLLNEQDNDAILEALHTLTEQVPADRYPYGRLKRILSMLQ